MISDSGEAVADPRFPLEGVSQLPMQLNFVKFVCQYKKSGPLGAPGAPPPWIRHCEVILVNDSSCTLVVKL